MRESRLIRHLVRKSLIPLALQQMAESTNSESDKKRRKRSGSNRFGSLHTSLKLQIISAYLPAFTTALKKWPYTLHYIDAFAGTGECEITVNGKQLTVPGSAKLAIDCAPPFHKLVFIEKSRSKRKGLEALKAVAASRDIEVVPGDANQALPGCISKLSKRADRAIVFLDPCGMEVEWGTLQGVARTEFTDVWYLFPLGGLYRQATISELDLTNEKAAALTRIFGTEEWRAAFYPVKHDLLGQVPGVRTLGVPEMVAWVKGRLETIFPKVAEPKLLYRESSVGTQIPIFALFFAISNPKPSAYQLALRIAESVLKKEVQGPEARPTSDAPASDQPPSSQRKLW